MNFLISVHDFWKKNLVPQKLRATNNNNNNNNHNNNK